MADSANELLQQFQKQKVSQESEILQAAQRFVNQFRALHLLGESFVQEFNKELLACSPDVRRLFPSLMGGNEVRSYLEFLEKQQPQSTETSADSNQPSIASDGYLPSPESDLMEQNPSDTISVPKAQWQQMQEQQKMLMEQTQQLLNKMNQQGTRSSAEMGHYSEIIEEDS